MGNQLVTTGMIFAAIGVAIEGIGAMAMVHNPIRRRLPSPFMLFAIGFTLFLLGAALAVMGRTIFPELP